MAVFLAEDGLGVIRILSRWGASDNAITPLTCS
jgi:hypothetical protein